MRARWWEPQDGPWKVSWPLSLVVVLVSALVALWLTE